MEATGMSGTMDDLDARGGYGPDFPGANGPDPNHRPGRILTGAEFIAGHVPPVWLIEGIVQRSRLYACTSLTGHGKTAVWLFNACMIHAGRKIGHLDTFRGNTLILAGENPSDLEARMIGMAKTYNLPRDQLPYVLPGGFPMIEAQAEALKSAIAGLGVPLALIVGDTASSYFPGDDENSNVQAGNYARTLRGFTECEGNPAVVVLSHPIKNANRESLRPRGGGAFLNELDGNLDIWALSQGEVTEMHWCDKIRGPDFAPLGYRLRIVPTGLADEKHLPEMTIIAEPMSEEAIADHSKQALANEDAVLLAMRDNPDWSFAQIAIGAGWVDDGGNPMKPRVQRAIKSLAAGKLVTQMRRGAPWTLTEKGKEALAARYSRPTSGATGRPWTDEDVDISPKAATPEPPPPPSEAEIEAEIERLRDMSDAAFLALDRNATAIILRCKPHEVAGLRKRAQDAAKARAKAAIVANTKTARARKAGKPRRGAGAKVAAIMTAKAATKATKPRAKKAAKPVDVS
jgi:hypothetical protein